jgi:hypothetical protein
LEQSIEFLKLAVEIRRDKKSFPFGTCETRASSGRRNVSNSPGINAQQRRPNTNFTIKVDPFGGSNVGRQTPAVSCSNPFTEKHNDEILF